MCLFKIGALGVLLQSKPESDNYYMKEKRKKLKKTKANRRRRKMFFSTSVILQKIEVEISYEKENNINGR